MKKAVKSAWRISQLDTVGQWSEFDFGTQLNQTTWIDFKEV
jgi:hypothetical protein